MADTTAVPGDHTFELAGKEQDKLQIKLEAVLCLHAHARATHHEFLPIDFCSFSVNKYLSTTKIRFQRFNYDIIAGDGLFNTRTTLKDVCDL